MRHYVMLLALGMLLAGCVPGAGSGRNPSSIPPGGELRWSIEGVNDIASIDPANPGDAQSNTIINLIFGGLVRLDEALTVQPDGAEQWSVSADGTAYTFTIRNGLRFATGQVVTAADFAYAINRALSPATKSFGAPSQLSHIVGATAVVEGRADQASGVRAISDRALEIRLDKPSAYFLAQLTYPYTFVVPRALVESGAAWFDQAYGTGPFTVKQWDHGKEIVLERNPNYWRGPAGVDRVRLPFFPDSEVAYQQYRAGNLDIMGSQQNGVPAGRVAEVRGQTDFRTASAATLRYVGFNNTLPPFDNVYVRQAFALAVDREALVRDALAGTAVATGRILPPGFPGSQNAVKGQSFDPSAARTTLGLAGFLSGQGVPPVTLAYGQEGDNQRVVEALAAFWRDNLGVSVSTQPLALNEFSAQLDLTQRDPEQGLQLYLSVWGADYPDPQNFLSQQLLTGTANNNGHWSSDAFDELVQQADIMGGLDQVDQRLSLYTRAEQIALDEVGWLPLYTPQLNVLVRPNVSGLYFTPQGIIASDWPAVRIAR
ncbi:MAG: peptide ABC transporter substrate-binding protein [Chloroflexales bacterium]|nr:peptide ABC transporter substrate-binding protein [Chloroflexales bacterium]